MKKIIFVLLTLALCLSFTTFAEENIEVDIAELYSETASGNCGTNLIWTLDAEGTLTISGSGNMKNWYSYSNVPWYSNRESIKNVVIGDSVTSIGDDAFGGCTSLASITIGNSVTSIGYRAFYNCTSLASITIPDRVTSIGERVFYNCTSLASITIPDSVTSISSYAFSGCDSLASITIPNSVTSIGSSAFSGCDSLASITIGNSVKSIGEEAFRDCTSLECVEIGIGVKSIEDKAFSFCSSLKSIEIPMGVKRICEYAFEHCKSLKSIEIPSSVTEIDEYVFKSCTSLANITIPDSVTSIGYFAFSGCTSLANITIPDSVTSIGDYAFSYCDSLASITIPDSVISIGKYAFLGCTSLASITIGDSVTSIGNGAFFGCDSLASITIPDSVTSIGNEAFCDCDSLTSITIPDSVTRIGSSAFSLCGRLSDIYITDLEAWCNIDFYDSGSNPLYEGENLYLNGVKLSELHIPDTVSTIKKYTFYDMGCANKLYIPKSVKKINQSAFQYCTNIKEIYYEGTAEEWEYIAIASGNDILKTATLYTDYIPESYKVYFESGTDEDVSDMPEIKFALGTFTFPEEKPKRVGYRFLGWSDEKNGEVKFTPGQKTEIFEEKTFYAVWEKKVTIFDNPITLQAAPFFSLDGKTATVIINLSDSVGFGGLSFDVEYDSDILTLTSVTPAFASQYCTFDEDSDGVVSFNITNDENIIGNGALALLSFDVAEDLDSIFTEITITPDDENCFGYDEDDDYNPAPLNVETINGKIKPKGDFTGDGVVDMNDAILLLQHSLFPELYPIE